MTLLTASYLAAFTTLNSRTPSTDDMINVVFRILASVSDFGYRPCLGQCGKVPEELKAVGREMIVSAPRYTEHNS